MAHGELWRSQPYLSQTLSWESKHSKLAFQFRELSDAVVDSFERDAHLIPIQNEFWRQLFEKEAQLVTLDKVSVSEVLPRPNDIKARKWLQIHSFIQGALLQSGVQYWVDWCGGKGHLLRSFLAREPVGGMVLERNHELCQAGQALSGSQLNVSFSCADVLHDSLPKPAKSPSGIMAMHACGQLTDKAIHYGLEHRMDVFALLPCCYHHQPKDWQPLSKHGQRMNIGLTKHSMRLPSLLEHTLRKRRRELRQQQLIFRLAFQALYQLARLPVPELPSFPRRFFYLSFEGFCNAASESIQLKLPFEPQFSAAIEVGRRRAGQARRLALIHAPFRKAIEVWINMDRALYLAEQGLKVEVKQICSASVTPRNVVILANRS